MMNRQKNFSVDVFHEGLTLPIFDLRISYGTHFKSIRLLDFKFVFDLVLVS